MVTFQNKGDDKITTPFNILIFEDRDNDGHYTAGVDNAFGTSTFVTGPTASITAIWPEGAGLVNIPLSGTVTFLHAPLYALIDSSDAIMEQDEANNLLVSCKDCQVAPTNPIQPVVSWKWQQPNASNRLVYTSPVIANLQDTNGDGYVNQEDIPTIAINARNEDFLSAPSIGKLWGFTRRYGCSSVFVAFYGPSDLLLGVFGNWRYQ